MKTLKTLKTITLFAIVLITLVTVRTEAQAAAYQSAESDYEYEIKKSGVIITKYTGLSLQQVMEETYSVVVPDKIAGKKVTSIAPYAFAEQKRISEFVLPQTVTSIGAHAFYNCQGMTSVKLPSSLKKIGEYAFYNTQIKKISIPKKVKSIGNYAFGCDKTVLNPVTTEVSVNKSNKKFTAVDGVLYNKSKSQLIYYPGAKKGKTYTATSKLISMSKWAFHDAMRLENVSLSKSKITSISENAFQIVTLKKISFPKTLKKIGAHAFEKSGVTAVAIPQNVASIGEATFYNCSNLKKVTISSKKLTVLSNDIFASCRFLTSVTLPESLTAIGEGAFNNCISLKKITIPKKVTSIGDRAFRLCEALTTVTIKGTVTHIGYSAFDGDPNLTIIAKKGTYPESFAKQKNIAFKKL